MKKLITENNARSKGFEGKRPLHLVCDNGSLPLVKLVIEYAGSGGLEDADDKTFLPIYYAAMYLHAPIVEFLTDNDNDDIRTSTLSMLPVILSVMLVSNQSDTQTLDAVTFLMDKLDLIDSRTLFLLPHTINEWCKRSDTKKPLTKQYVSNLIKD